MIKNIENERNIRNSFAPTKMIDASRKTQLELVPNLSRVACLDAKVRGKSFKGDFCPRIGLGGGPAPKHLMTSMWGR